MKTRELKGFNSLRALNVFHTLMLGVKMLPAYRETTYEKFFEAIEAMSPEKQEKIIREGALFVSLEREEVEALVRFCEDPNGVAYTAENLKSMSPDQIYEMVVAVCIQIAKIKINFVTPDEKKKLKNCTVDLRQTFAKNPNASLEETLNLAFFEAVQNVQ